MQIPRVAAATLVFGVGCNQNDPTPVEALASKFCRMFEACESDFSMYYASLAECEAATLPDLEAGFDEIAMTEGEACADALLAYYNCVVFNLSLTTCMPTSYTACNDEYAAAYDACY